MVLEVLDISPPAWAAGFEPAPGLLRDPIQEGPVQGGHPVVVELGGDGPVDRHLLGGPCRTSTAVPLDLLAARPGARPQSPALELVHRHQVGVVQHVDLLELAEAPNSDVIT
jgi:hypothetical protein